MIGRLGQDFLAAVLSLFVVVSGASAATNDKLPISDLAVLQYLLVWTGDYIGIVDGVGGPLTAAAIRQYHERSARQPPSRGNGAEPAPDWTENLIADAVEALARYDFVLFRDNEIMERAACSSISWDRVQGPIPDKLLPFSSFQPWPCF